MEAKKISRKHLAILFFSIILSIPLCGCTSLKTPEINGVVVDAETGKPIEGAYVVVSWAPMYGTVGGDVGGRASKKIKLQTDKNGVFRIPRHRLINWKPYPCGKGGNFAMSIYTHGYMHEGYLFYSEGDLEHPKYAAFRGVIGGNKLIVKLQPINDPDTFDKNSSETYGLTENDLNYQLKEYQLYLSRFPAENKVPGHMLSIGTIYERMKQHESAINEYKKIIQLYPNSDDAKVAHERILKLSK